MGSFRWPHDNNSKKGGGLAELVPEDQAEGGLCGARTQVLRVWLGTPIGPGDTPAPSWHCALWVGPCVCSYARDNFLPGLSLITHFIHLPWLQIGYFQKCMSPSLGESAGNDLKFSKECVAHPESRSPGGWGWGTQLVLSHTPCWN